MKKMIVLISAMLACLLALGAPAGGEAPPEAAALRLVPGETLPVTLRITAKTAGMQARLCWDPLLLSVEEETPAFSAEFKSGAMLSMLNPDPEAGAINLVYLRQSDLEAQDMEVLALTFRVREDAISGITGISIEGLQLVNAENNAVDALAEGLLIEIDANADEIPEPTEAPEPDETASPEPTPDAEVIPAARLYIVPVPSPEPTATPTPEPTNTPKPTATPTPKPTNTPKPTATPTPEPTHTPKPAPTPTRPSGHISSGSGDSSATITPRPKPTVTPSPTTPGIAIDGKDTAPETGKADGEHIRLSVRAIEGGVAVDLLAKDVKIGGLQAEIGYDAESITLKHAAFSEAFLENAMIHMINDAQPGVISVVYSNLSGHEADGSAIFTAEFRGSVEKNTEFSLRNAKYTGTGAEMTAAEIASQQVSYTVQPMQDLEIVESDGVKILRLDAGRSFSLTMDPGASISLQLNDREIPQVFWTSDRDPVASVTAEGLVDCHSSGLALLSAWDASNGQLLAEGRICVRNAQFGIPIELLNLTIGASEGDLLALSSSVNEAEYALRGIALTFQEGENLLRIEGLLPAEMESFPAAALDLCGSLVEVEIVAENIRWIETGAFSRCDRLEKLTIRGRQTELFPDSLPESGECVLLMSEESAAAAAAQGIACEVLKEAGEAK